MAKGSLRINEISNAANVLLNVIFILLSFLCIYPILLVIGTSFAEETYLNVVGYKAFPKVISLDAYKYVLSNAKPITNAYIVTIITTLTGTVLSTLMIALYAYAIVQQGFKYRRFFTFFIFFTMLFNGGIVPWYIVCTQVLKIQNTLIALVWPYLINAWYVMVMKTFYNTTVPSAIIEAAKIDGASELKTFFRIVFPIAIPGLATIALFMTLRYWNDWYLPFMLTSDPRLSNIQMYLKRILNNLQELLNSSSAAMQAGSMLAVVPREGARMAICALAVGPIVLAYPFFQRFFVKGLTIGSVKG